MDMAPAIMMGSLSLEPGSGDTRQALSSMMRRPSSSVEPSGEVAASVGYPWSILKAGGPSMRLLSFSKSESE